MLRLGTKSKGEIKDEDVKIEPPKKKKFLEFFQYSITSLCYVGRGRWWLKRPPQDRGIVVIMGPIAFEERSVKAETSYPYYLLSFPNL